MVTVLGSTQGTFCSSEKGGSGGAALRWVSAYLPYKFCHPTMVLLTCKARFMEIEVTSSFL
jgi:hypothetical protein